MYKKIILLSLCFTIFGCALNPEPARPKLNPTVELKDNTVVNNLGIVAINATDARESTVIGHRFLETMSPPIEIDNLAPALKEGFITMVQRRGYALSTDQAKASRFINARLLVFRSTYLPQFPVEHYKVDVAIEVTAKNKTTNFDHIYRISQKIRLTFGGDTDKQLQDDLNRVFSKLLSQIAEDSDLWNFMAKQ